MVKVPEKPPLISSKYECPVVKATRILPPYSPRIVKGNKKGRREEYGKHLLSILYRILTSILLYLQMFPLL